jgi:hypothetical protein
MICGRCGGILRTEGIILNDGESCQGVTCYRCGNYFDPIVLENRTPERRAYWKQRTDQDARELSRIEKIIAQNEPEAIRLNY